MSNPNVIPLVQRKTRAESTNVETIVGRLQSGRIVIPDYQRDAEQWDIRKESLFYELGGYICPDCKQVFAGPSGFRRLHGDHIIPRSRGGPTVWENLILRCGPCNIAKSNKLPVERSG